MRRSESDGAALVGSLGMRAFDVSSVPTAGPTATAGTPTFAYGRRSRSVLNDWTSGTPLGGQNLLISPASAARVQPPFAVDPSPTVSSATQMSSRTPAPPTSSEQTHSRTFSGRGAFDLSPHALAAVLAASRIPSSATPVASGGGTTTNTSLQNTFQSPSSPANATHVGSERERSAGARNEGNSVPAFEAPSTPSRFSSAAAAAAAAFERSPGKPTPSSSAPAAPPSAASGAGAHALSVHFPTEGLRESLEYRRGETSQLHARRPRALWQDDEEEHAAALSNDEDQVAAEEFFDEDSPQQQQETWRHGQRFASAPSRTSSRRLDWADAPISAAQRPSAPSALVVSASDDDADLERHDRGEPHPAQLLPGEAAALPLPLYSPQRARARGERSIISATLSLPASASGAADTPHTRPHPSTPSQGHHKTAHAPHQLAHSTSAQSATAAGSSPSELSLAPPAFGRKSHFTQARSRKEGGSASQLHMTASSYSLTDSGAALALGLAPWPLGEEELNAAAAHCAAIRNQLGQFRVDQNKFGELQDLEQQISQLHARKKPVLATLLLLSSFRVLLNCYSAARIASCLPPLLFYPYLPYVNAYIACVCVFVCACACEAGVRT